MRKRTIICFLLAFFTLFGLYPSVNAAAVTTTCTIYSGGNIEDQNYQRWSKPIKSYLTTAPDGTIMRVQAGSSANGILVEYYDAAYNLQSTKIIPEELPIFGGFHETDSNYYLVTGQSNNDESAEVEVFRITKYDKNWKRLASTGLSDCNTTVPFDAGNLRMDTCGNYLLIRTSHEMYASSDGYNHQANVTIEVNMDTMEITDSYTKIMNSSFGYVSHSFNQFVKIEGNKMITVDHGDAHPRSIALIQYPTDVSTGKFQSGYCSVTDVLTFPGKTGQNSTGASVGGFEISDSSYLIAGNSVVQDENNLTRSTRNVFVAAVDKTTSEVTMNWLTSYSESDGTTSTPHMVELTNGNYMILWSRDNMVYYTQIDKNGNSVSIIYSHAGSLSDCVPIVNNGKLIWYTWKNNLMTFYDITLNDLSAFHTEVIENGHKYQLISTKDGYATLKCSVCQESTQIAVVTSYSMYWNTDGGNRYSAFVDLDQTMGGNVYFWIYNPSGVDNAQNLNTEMEVLSSDESVISVTRSSNGLMGSLNMKKAGSSVITIRPKYNPEASRTYTFTVYAPLELTSFTADPASSQRFQTEVSLTAAADGGRGNTQYRFYLTDNSGKTVELQGYSQKSTCSWLPDTTGTYTLYVEAKDSSGTVVTKAIENYTIEKANALTLEAMEKAFCYQIAAPDQTMDVAALLPANRGTTNYTVTTDDNSRILENVTVNENGILTYSVKDSTAIGDSAAITVQISMAHYETSALRVQIQITDKRSITEKPGAAVAIDGSEPLIYGQKLQNAALNTGSVVFIDDDGDAVDGTLTWENPEMVPETGNTEATWIFRPDEPQYKECTGSLTLTVRKADVKANVPEISPVSYDPEKTLADISLGEGTAVTLNGQAGQPVEGVWTWKNPDLVPTAGKQICAAVFTPTEENHYHSVTAEITFTVKKAAPVISSMPQADGITYGQTLADSHLENGNAKLGNISISGNFVWQEPSAAPTVSDSDTTKYAISFVPDDQNNYETIVCGSITLTVLPAENVPNAPGSVMNVSNSTTQVGKIPLPEGWTWEDSGTKLFPEEPVTAIAVFEDSVNYKNFRVAITITRSSCEHIESDLVVDVKATCTENGYGHTTCSLCNEILRTNILIDAGHHWDSGVISRQPTTTAAGTRTYTCKNCGTTKEISIPKRIPSVKKGQTATFNNLKYKVTKAGKSGSAEVMLTASTRKNATVIKIPDTITINQVVCRVVSIKAKAFCKNKKLSKVTLGRNIATINGKAFYNCKKLKAITIKSKVLKRVGKNAIRGIAPKAKIKVPKACAKKYRRLFNTKTGFTKTMKLK